jgi:hypothetical protein
MSLWQKYLNSLFVICLSLVGFDCMAQWYDSDLGWYLSEQPPTAFNPKDSRLPSSRENSSRWNDSDSESNSRWDDYEGNDSSATSLTAWEREDLSRQETTKDKSQQPNLSSWEQEGLNAQKPEIKQSPHSNLTPWELEDLKLRAQKRENRQTQKKHKNQSPQGPWRAHINKKKEKPKDAVVIKRTPSPLITPANSQANQDLEVIPQVVQEESKVESSELAAEKELDPKLSPQKTPESGFCENCKPIKKVVIPKALEKFVFEKTFITGPIAKGARAYMAAAYRSCQAISEETPLVNYENTRDIDQHYFKMEDPDKAVFYNTGITKLNAGTIEKIKKTHPYWFDQDKSPNPSCRLDLPPAFQYGGDSGVAIGKNGEIKINAKINQWSSQKTKNNGFKKFRQGVDCSNFVKAATFLGGKRFVEGSNDPWVTTKRLMTLPSQGKSCFEYPQLQKDKSIQSGDIFVIPGHTFIIESSGVDPFGLKGITDCKRQLSSRRFNFTIIHSSSAHGRVGIQRNSATDYVKHNDYAGAAIIEIAQKACRAQTGKAISKASEPDVVSVLRHVSENPTANAAKKSKCEVPQEQKENLQFDGEECIESCKSGE